MIPDDVPEDLRELAEILDEMGTEERAVLREARGSSWNKPEESEEKGKRGGSEDRQGEAGRDSLRLPRSVWFLLPLAAAALLWLVFRPGATPAVEAPPRMLSGAGISLLGGGVAPGEVLRWTYPGEGPFVYDVRILDPRRASASAPLFRARVRVSEVQLPLERPDPWPDTILLAIDVLDEGGRVLDSFEGELSSSSPSR